MAQALSSMRSAIVPLACALLGAALGVLLERKLRSRRNSEGPDEQPAADARSSTDVVNSGAEVRVPVAELEAAVAVCLERAGASHAHAQLVAEVLVAADRRGVPSHGINRAEMYCSELQAGLIDGSATPVVASETTSVASVDGRNALGAVVSKFALELCAKKAKATGLGLVVCRRSNHFGIAGYWSELALCKGLIAFAFTNTSPFLVPTRATSRAGGTNPIACFCPATAGDSFQLDMATTTVPVGKVEVCHRKGQRRIPVGWGVDAAGHSTTDPAVVLKEGGLTPLGGMEETAGYKGYGLNMMVEILCSILSGCEASGPDVLPWRADRGRPIDYGHCFLCIDPEQVSPGGHFPERLSRYLARMRGLEAADPLRAVLVPGDPERAEAKRAANEGVRLSQNVALGFKRFVRELGCEESLPSQLRSLPEDVEVPVHPFAAGSQTV